MIDRVMKDLVMGPMSRHFGVKSNRLLSTRRLMDIAKRHNTFWYGTYQKYREAAYRDSFTKLIEENGAPTSPICEMKNGWVIDDSMSLPYLQDVLRDANEIIEERKGERQKLGTYRTFFQDIFCKEDADRYSSFLNFVASSEVLSTVCNYLSYIPVLSDFIPQGIRLAESYIKFDDMPDQGYRDSQLFHRDPHDSPLVYVIVALRDIAMENGPFCFLPMDVSKRVTRALGYWNKGCPYRVSDQRVFQVVGENELQRFCCPAGTVLFIDSSNCFHYGSRDCNQPRYMLMYGLVSACRTDFAHLFRDRYKTRYRIDESDSLLKRMLLDRDFLE